MVIVVVVGLVMIVPAVMVIVVVVGLVMIVPAVMVIVVVVGLVMTDIRGPKMVNVAVVLVVYGAMAEPLRQKRVPRVGAGLPEEVRRGLARIKASTKRELEADYQPPSEQDDPEGFAKHEAREAKRAAGLANRDRLRDEAKAAIARSGTKPAPREPRKKRVPAAQERRPLVPHKLPDPKRQLKEVLGDSGGGRAWRDLNQGSRTSRRWQNRPGSSHR